MDIVGYKLAILSAYLKGKKVVLVDDKQEYKHLCEQLNVDYEIIEVADERKGNNIE